MKKLVLILTLLLAVGLLAACSQDGGSAADDDVIRVALVTGTGGRGDESFNDMAIAGLERAVELYGDAFDWDYATPPSVADFEDNIERFAQTGNYDLIIVTSFQANAAMYAVAERFPDQQFSIVDTSVHMPNVRSIVKDFAEMTFLGGYLAGLMTLDATIPNINEALVGIVIGTDSPPMQNAARGFTAGAMLANPDVDARINIVGSFGDPALGREISLSLFGEGASVIMSFAGGSGAGVTLAAQELDMYAIAGAFPRTADAPDNIPASVGEHLTNQMLLEVQSLKNDTWEAGIFMGTLANDYLGISFDGSNIVLPAGMADRVEAARQRVVSGELSIPATLDEIPAWAAANSR